jgi:hypothetical protein
MMLGDSCDSVVDPWACLTASCLADHFFKNYGCTTKHSFCALCHTSYMQCYTHEWRHSVLHTHTYMYFCTTLVPEPLLMKSFLYNSLIKGVPGKEPQRP